MLILTLIFISKVYLENEELKHNAEEIKYKIYNIRRLYSNSMRKLLYLELSGNANSRNEKLEAMSQILEDLNHQPEIYVENIFGVESDDLHTPIKINDIPNSQMYTVKDMDFNVLELDNFPLDDESLMRHFKIKEYEGKIFAHVLFPFYYQHKLIKVHGVIFDLTKNLENLFEKRNSFFKEAYYVDNNGLIIGHIHTPPHGWTYSNINNLKKIELDSSYKTLSVYDDYLITYKLNMFSILFYSLAFSSIIMIVMKRLLKYIEKYNYIHQRSLLDPLTNIYNRRGFFEFYKKNPQLIAIAVLDIDDFKKINDSYGHDAGDKVLIKVSSLLQSIFLKCEENKELQSKNCCVRWGGEEFWVGMPFTDEAEFLDLLDMVKEEAKKLSFKDYPNLKVTVSIGASIRNIDSIKIFHDTFKIADSNLYKAKKTGKNKIIFSNEIS